MSNHGFAQLPRWILHDPHFPATSKWVLLALISVARGDRYAWPSQAWLAAVTGTSIASVRRATRHLESVGLIATTRYRNSDGRVCLRYRIEVEPSGLKPLTLSGSEPLTET